MTWELHETLMEMCRRRAWGVGARTGILVGFGLGLLAAATLIRCAEVWR